MATYFIRRDTARQYYWVLRSDKNYEIVARSSESYVSKAGAEGSIQWVKANAKDATVVDES